MNSDPTSLGHQLLALLEAVRDTHDDSARASLNELLRNDPAARAAMARLMVDEQALITRLRDDSIVSLLDPAPSRALAKVVRFPRWFAWRPLTAAAAGIVFGMFCTSVVFGFVVQRGGEKRTPLAVFEPGFENAQIPLANGFPVRPAQWSGDAARVVAAEDGVAPKEGKFMLRLEPMSKGVPRMYQVLDLQSLPSGAGADSREIEVSASFAAAKAEAPVRYWIRAVAATEAPEKLDAAWLDLREEAIASATKGLDVGPGTKGWQTVSVKIQVPRAARSLVLFFGVRTPDKTARISPHYFDDVHVSLLTPAALP